MYPVIGHGKYYRRFSGLYSVVTFKRFVKTDFTFINILSNLADGVIKDVFGTSSITSLESM